MSRKELADQINKVLTDHEIDNAKWSNTANCVQVWCKCGVEFFYREDKEVHAKHSGSKLLAEVERLLADEREKVREMFIEKLAAAIRQLDLTAPSGTDEEK